jgi:hypothetical protein
MLPGNALETATVVRRVGVYGGCLGSFLEKVTSKQKSKGEMNTPVTFQVLF